MALAVNGLSYERNKKLLFTNLAFQVCPGEALHIIGPNGAGKTSLLQVLTGLVRPLHGDILWNDVCIHNSQLFQKTLLYISHKLGMKGVLTPVENLYLFLVRRGLRIGNRSINQLKQAAKENIVNVLEKLNLTPYSERLTNSLSIGQQRRLALAKLLLIKSDCWILDEPFTALDSKGIDFFSLVIKEQLYQGGIVIFTSHQASTLSNIDIKTLFLAHGGV
ncbi:MAG: cytochrome c biogenesis heme-transporting ATPase CcmA [Pseudomonadota bacterium]